MNRHEESIKQLHMFDYKACLHAYNKHTCPQLKHEEYLNDDLQWETLVGTHIWRTFEDYFKSTSNPL